MATLVLTALGSAVAGPIGGAIGSMLGQAVDRATIFKPPTREGPRLTELAVQTSSYGTQIPKLFGTLRVAGTIIWAADLVETRSSGGGGKGRSATTSYDYAASFAVLLSARAIRGVARIWADGTLIRGAGGDWKTTTGFRLHPGGDDQTVDPLIASAEGAMASACRGYAYAVFEGLPLAAFGNRIPSLTFEVIADAGPVAVGVIAAALADEVDGDAALTLDGFAAAGTSVAGVLETLATLGGAWWAPTGARLAMRDGAGDALATVADDGAAKRRMRTVAAIDTVPRGIAVAHYDAARDYQIGVQRARRPGAGEREERIELPAVMPASRAKAIAAAMLVRAEAERVRRTVATGFAGLAVAPGACVRIAGEGGIWRVAAARVEGMATSLDLIPVARVPIVTSPAASGRVAAAADQPIGATILHAFEMTVAGDVPATAPRLSVAGTGMGAGWRRAALLYSSDDGASWIAAGSTAAAAILGRIERVAGTAPTTLYDHRGAFVVGLARDDMVLGDADAGAMDAGANLAMLGDELVQFGVATPLGGGRWRLSRLLRGRRGTEAAIGTQAPGDRFVLVEPDAVRTIELPPSAMGATLRVMASGVGDLDRPVEAAVAIRGVSVVPPSPVAVAALLDPGGGLVVTWVRRSRAGWRWTDGVDAPLVEETERYRVTMSGSAGERTVEVGTTIAAIPVDEMPAGATRVSVRQLGTYGASAPGEATIGGANG